MKTILVPFFLGFILFCKAQFTVTVDVSSQFMAKNMVVYTLSGSKDIIAATHIRKGNQFHVNVDKNYTGMMKAYFPDANASFFFISENKPVEVSVNTTSTKILEIIYKDEVNVLMEKSQDIQRKSEQILPVLKQLQGYYSATSKFGQALSLEINELEQPIVLNPQKNPFIHFFSTHYKKFVVDKKMDDTKQKEVLAFLQQSNDMLEHSSLLKPILLNYLNAVGNERVKSEMDNLLLKLNVETVRGQTVLSELIDIFDAYDMADLKTYYLEKAKNLKCTIHERLALTMSTNANIEIGAKFPDLKMENAINTRLKSLHEIKSDKKVVVFWSSTCSHCETELPQLFQYYKQMKEKGIEIIGFSLDTISTSYESKSNNLPWVNASELKGWNSTYVDVLNIHATPSYFVLNSENKIIQKPNHASDVIEYLQLK